IYGGPDVVVDRFKAWEISAAVPHAAHVEAEGRNPCFREGAGQQDKLPMAADAVLRPADHDDDPCFRGLCRRMDDANQRRPVAGKADRTLVGIHAPAPASARTVAAIRAGAVAISCVVQNCSPATL